MQAKSKHSETCNAILRIETVKDENDVQEADSEDNVYVMRIFIGTIDYETEALRKLKRVSLNLEEPIKPIEVTGHSNGIFPPKSPEEAFRYLDTAKVMAIMTETYQKKVVLSNLNFTVHNFIETQNHMIFMGNSLPPVVFLKKDLAGVEAAPTPNFKFSVGCRSYFSCCLDVSIKYGAAVADEVFYYVTKNLTVESLDLKMDDFEEKTVFQDRLVEDVEVVEDRYIGLLTLDGRVVVDDYEVELVRDKELESELVFQRLKACKRYLIASARILPNSYKPKDLHINKVAKGTSKTPNRLFLLTNSRHPVVYDTHVLREDEKVASKDELTHILDILTLEKFKMPLVLCLNKNSDLKLLAISKRYRRFIFLTELIESKAKLPTVLGYHSNIIFKCGNGFIYQYSLHL